MPSPQRCPTGRAERMGRARSSMLRADTPHPVVPGSPALPARSPASLHPQSLVRVCSTCASDSHLQIRTVLPTPRLYEFYPVFSSSVCSQWQESAPTRGSVAAETCGFPGHWVRQVGPTGRNVSHPGQWICRVRGEIFLDASSYAHGKCRPTSEPCSLARSP